MKQLLADFQRWLVDQRHVDDGGGAFAEALGEKLNRLGFPLWRQSFTLNTMHPEVLWRTMVWTSDGVIKAVDRPHSQLQEAFFLKSPIPQLIAGGPPLLVDLTGTDPLPYPICEDLRAEGGTAYFAMGLKSSFGGFGYISLSTRAPGGFPPDSLALLKEASPFLARRIELEASYHLTNSLLQVYLGKNAAQRVIEGQFKRGQGELIQAAIWFCDLRGFTEMSDRIAPQEMIALLDSYFEIVSECVAAEGGEVLKFIGDAVLAVFPVGDDPAEACRKALFAAEAALNFLEMHKAGSAEAGQLQVGIALHLGEVMYGNIGGRNRLDFTVISTAVNQAARLEALCKDLGTQLVLSETFSQAVGTDGLRELGQHTLKGLKRPVSVYTTKGR